MKNNEQRLHGKRKEEVMARLGYMTNLIESYSRKANDKSIIYIRFIIRVLFALTMYLQCTCYNFFRKQKDGFYLSLLVYIRFYIHLIYRKL